MSLINKMLQELDRRHARAAPQGQVPHPEVRAVHVARSGQEWFWRVVAALMLVAAVWTLWVVYQLQPRSVATELAYRAAENSRRRAASAPPPAPVAVAPAAPGVAAPPAPSVAVPAAPSAVVVATVPAPEKLAAPIEALRLALTIDTPLAPRSAQSRHSAPAGIAAARAASVSRPQVRSAAAGAPARVEKRPIAGSPADRAEMEYRRAAQMLERGRVADAEQALLAALGAHHAHQAARQTLVALYLEQKRIDEARRQLQEGLAVNSAYMPFAVALARIHVDRRDYTVALEILDQANKTGQASADFHMLRAAILQRMGRHGEAADAYRAALGIGAQSGAAWVGLGISLDALGSKPEAAEAFRRGVASGALAEEVRAYAAQRMRQLQ
jgi:tetratricopeptide (TPR) repeat protein